jgi:hypothetical protein
MSASHVHAPNPQNVDGVLHALEEWWIQEGRAPRATHQADRNGSSELGHDTYLAPSIVPPEPAIDPNEEISVEETASDKPSLGRRVFRAIIGSIVIAVIATLAWQAYSDDQTKDMVQAWWSSAHGLKSKHGSVLAANNTPQLSDQTAAASLSPPTPVAAAEASPELLQQLQTIVSDLAVLRHAVEEIASKQDRTSRDIASLQAAEQNVGQQISSLARATSIRAAAQKNAPKLPHSQAPQQSTTTAPAPAPAPAPPPARPPLPVPSATPSPAN